MSRHAPPLPFSPYYDFHVVKPMTVAGQALKLGDPLPKDSLSPRRLRQLFEARMISPLPPTVLPINPVTSPAGEPGASNGSGSSKEALARASKPLRAFHKGFGKWVVLDSSGQEVSGPHAREEAERLADS